VAKGLSLGNRNARRHVLRLLSTSKVLSLNTEKYESSDKVTVWSGDLDNGPRVSLCWRSAQLSDERKNIKRGKFQLLNLECRCFEMLTL